MKPKLQWDTSKRAKELRLLYPFGDKDRDRVPNIFDCQPFNPYEHGFGGSIVTGVKQTVSQTVRRVQPKIQQVAGRAQRVVRHVQPRIQQRIRQRIETVRPRPTGVIKKGIEYTRRGAKKLFVEGEVKKVPRDVLKGTGVMGKGLKMMWKGESGIPGVKAPSLKKAVTPTGVVGGVKTIGKGLRMMAHGKPEIIPSAQAKQLPKFSIIKTIPYKREFLSMGQKVTGAVSTATTAVKSRMAAIKPTIKRYAEEVVKKPVTVVEGLEKKYSPYVKKVILPVRPYAEVKTPGDLVRAVEQTYKWRGAELSKEQREAIKESYIKGKEAYGIYRKIWGLPPEPFKWEKKAAQVEAGIKAGQVEEIRERPVKGAITVVSFAALPPVFKGAGAVWKGTGLAAKLPRTTKYAPRAIFGAMGAGYAGTVGYETYKAPTLEKKGEVLGRTSVELAEMAAGTYIGIKAPGILAGGLRGFKTRVTRKKIPIEKITTPEIVSGKKVLLHAPKGTTPKELVEQFKAAERVFSLPGEEYGKGIKVWRAAPVEYGAETIVRRGEFAMPGMYTSPALSPHFLRIKPPKTEISLFGMDIPEPIPSAEPTAYRITTRDILRLPLKVRKTDIPSEASWFMGKGEVGKGYISSEFEIGKTEAEAVLPVTTGLKRIQGRYYTTWKGKAVPIEEMEVVETGIPRISIGFEKGKYYVRRPRGTAIIETDKGIILCKDKRGEYILPGGEIEIAAVKGLEGKKVRGESALEGTIREIYEELGLSPIKSRYLFKKEGSEISLYSLPGGRQHWWSKNIYSVFEFKVRGRPKLRSHEVKDIIYYKPGMKIKLSKDTEAILKRYFSLKKKRPLKDIRPIVKRVEERIKTKKSKIRKKRKVTTVEELLREEEYLARPRKATLISPLSLGVEYAISSLLGRPRIRYGLKPSYRRKYPPSEPSKERGKVSPEEWLIPKRGRRYEQYPPRERRRPREEEYPLSLPERILPERGREERGRRGERRPPEYGRGYERYPSRRRYPPERIPSILAPRARPYYPLTPKLKVKKKRKKPKEEWAGYLEIASIRMPKDIIEDAINILGGMKK